ncbi:calmodulin-regulated spectrin-associated protein 1 isoform X2 [Hippopotamus amphibius kiboko]|uniref:calmodulin-regulated spectrin-associated protein 1 isoform X2 n=1 Tax=Hippopotamus amphibius kiboko TaxID=575201 RepID=UPI002598EEE7|nr:calmodulin-regulated spectrin-associated protein 1 isoform X2 [Hippopotamus amphibius kiboko]
MVDAGGGPAGEGWRRMEAAPDGAVDVVPLERYDPARAKIAANLQWICAKAYGRDDIPEDLRDPFYIDQYEQEHIKPPVIRLLLSSELYCRVCSLILRGDQVAALQGHQSVIQALSRKGIYVMESDDTPVMEPDLSHAPIKMSAHMAMVDALMMAYTVEMISIEKVVASVKRFSTFSASKELPYDLEDAMVFWVNKVNLKMREITEKEVKLKQQLLESPAHQKVRYRREHLSARQPPCFPLLEDLMRDGSHGAALLAVVHYYCPEHMKLDDICLKEVTSMADSLYNIRLLREFSNEYLNKCFYLTLEDMLYAPLVLKPNVMVFIAELFWWFENVKPDFVQPRDVQELKDAKSVSHPKSSRPPVPISNATKRSFLGSPAAASPADQQPPAQLHHLHLEEPEPPGKGASAFSPSHPLLPLRQKQQKTVQGEDPPDQRHRSNSLTRVDGQPRGAAVAWTEKKNRPMSQPAPFALHHAASCDVDPGSGDSVSLARSISKDSLASNVIHLTPQNQPQPAALRTSGKSLLNNVDIEDEDEELVAIVRTDVAHQGGDPGLMATARSPQRLVDASESKSDSFFLEPLMPALLRPAKEKQAVTKEDECGEGRPRGFAARRPGEGHQPPGRKKVPGSHVSRDLNRTFTPISCSELPAGFDPTPTEAGPLAVGDARGGPLAGSGFDLSSQGQSADGFFLHVGRADEDVEGRLYMSCVRSPGALGPEAWAVLRQDSDSDVADLEEAEQDFAGEGHPAAGAGYGGEEESAKLQEDLKVKEHEDKDDASGRSSPCLSTVSQISSVSVASGSVKMTSFAERKLQRLNSCETKSSTSSSQKTTPDASESCPAPLTTWKQRREQSPNRQGGDHASLLASELAQLHMQLEEKRRAIEAQKKKMEALSARQRLKLGKAAFLHVVKKGRADTAPQPLKAGPVVGEHPQHNGDDFDGLSRAGDFRGKEEGRGELLGSPDVDGEGLALVQQHTPKDPATLPELERSKALSAVLLEAGEGMDVGEGDLSIEKLNETISTLQQAILRISQQQEQLLLKSPTVPTPGPRGGSQDPKVKAAIHFVEPLSPPALTGHRKPPRLGQGRNSRSGRPAELKVPKERQQGSSRSKTPTPGVETTSHSRSFPPRTPSDLGWDGVADPGGDARENCSLDGYRLYDESNQRTFVLPSSKDADALLEQTGFKEALEGGVKEAGLGTLTAPGKENVPLDEPPRSKASLIEVDLSDLKAPNEGEETEGRDSAADLGGEGDQKPGVGFFFKVKRGRHPCHVVGTWEGVRETLTSWVGAGEAPAASWPRGLSEDPAGGSICGREHLRAGAWPRQPSGTSGPTREAASLSCTAIRERTHLVSSQAPQDGPWPLARGGPPPLAPAPLPALQGARGSALCCRSSWLHRDAPEPAGRGPGPGAWRAGAPWGGAAAPQVTSALQDEQKADDELAKKRAAFLLKQQRKAEEARVRRQQLEAEVELKRDEARRKAEEERIRKEEEKARRELIKQEYLRRKQQQILEEQGLGKARSRPKKPRPKSVHREEPGSELGPKSASPPDNLSRAQSGSSLSLASAATTEPESVHSGGTPSQRVESLEALPILSRNPSRSTDRDWETASAASSLASVAEYTGPKLFKEPSSKSNKPIIHNAVSHCCLAGKVNEPHKNSILEELEKCDANHYIILFRDAGCQFRALYCYYPDTEEIYKLTGTGPKSITKKMIDKLYKYSSDRKQFNLIPAKTMSVSVDALTIHNHLWQPKRPSVPKKTQTRK